MKKKLYIKTWGCQMNEYDSNKIINHLNINNEYVISSINEADVIIYNTCSVREKSKEKLFHELNKIKFIKKKNNELIVCVGGCVSLYEKENIFKRSNIVDIVFGPSNIDKIYYLIKNFNKKKRKKIINVSFSNIDKNINDCKFSVYKKSNSYVSIMEGCNKFCSYCVVPFTRGKEFFRTPEKIISEIYNLSLNGIKEVNLLGQNVNSYLSYFNNGKRCDFSNLLYLIAEINNIDRISFTTSHPNNFNKKIIDVYKYIPKIINYLHLPVQSGSDRILKLMNRNYTVEQYKKIIYEILSVRSNMLFGTDFIVGFPSENDDDFSLTLNLICDIKFSSSYIFIYSPRIGTKSFSMVDNVSYFDKKKRFLEIKERIKENSIFYNNKMLNTVQEIIIEGFSRKKNNLIYGRTNNNKIVYLSGNEKLFGKLVEVKIVEINNNCLYGKILF